MMMFEPITPTIGAWVRIAADMVLDGSVLEILFEALDRYDVLVFPQVKMSDATFAAMTARMGPMHELGLTA